MKDFVALSGPIHSRSCETPWFADTGADVSQSLLID
jgi:hypothetical protein